MANPDDFLYEYAIVRYVPRVDRQEFINIGLIMLCKRRRWLKGLIRLDQTRLRAFDPMINFEAIGQQARLFERTDLPSAELPCEERYRWLAAEKSAMLQVSPSHPGILQVADETTREQAVILLESEFQRLFNELVECRPDRTTHL